MNETENTQSGKQAQALLQLKLYRVEFDRTQGSRSQENPPVIPIPRGHDYTSPSNRVFLNQDKQE